MMSSPRTYQLLPPVEPLEPRQLLTSSPLGTELASFEVSIGGMALNPVQDTLYLSDVSQDWIYKLDIKTLQLVAEASTFDEPTRMVVSRDGTKLYVASTSVAAISVLSTDTLQEIRRINIPNPCDELVLGTGDTLFANVRDFRGYYRIDTATGTVVRLDSGLFTAFAATPDGTRLFASGPNHTPDYIWLSDGTGNFSTSHVIGGEIGERFAVSHNGRQVIAPTETGYDHWLLRSIDLHPIRPVSVSTSRAIYSPDDQYIYEVTQTSVRIASAATGNETARASLSLPHMNPSPLLETDHHGKYIFVGGEGNGGGLHVLSTGQLDAHTADARAIPNLITEFDATQSAGSITRYEWDLNGDGVFTDAYGVKPRLAWSALKALGITTPGQTFDIRVRVTDDLGQTSTSAPAKLSVTTAVGIPILTPSSSAITYGSPLTLSVRVPGSGTLPTGSVQIFMDGVARGSAALNAEGKASFRFGRPVAGEHRFHAVYSGDSRYPASTGPAIYVQSNKAPTSVTLQQVGEPEADNRLRLNVSVNFGQAPPAGQIEFLAGTISLGKTAVETGSLEVLLPPAPGGAQTITARYLGDANHLASSASLSTTLPPLRTSTNLSATSQGSTAVLTATVQSYIENVPGIVQFFAGGVLAGTAPLTSGVATITLADFAAGPQRFSAVYVGSEQFASSTSSTWTGNLQASTTLTVAASASESRRYEPFTLTAAVGTASRTALLPTGIVQFREGDVVLGSAQVSNGLATFTTTTLAPGFHYITAHYSGDAYFTGTISTPLSHHVIYTNVIDVIVAYTSAAAYSGIEDDIYAAIADANDAMINSRVEASIELVYAYETDYVESGDMDRDLTRFVTPRDGYLDDIQDLRNQYGADVAVLWLGESDLGGLAYVMRDLSDPQNDDRAYLALLGNQAGAPSYTFAHELGHVLGAAHDRENSDTSGLYSYSYGYRFTAGGTVYHDIMSYDPGETIPYYANPNVLYDGVPTGSSSSNVAATFDRSVPVVSRYRSTRVPSSTPVSVTLSSSLASGSNFDAFTLTARITPTLSSAQTPRGVVTFFDGATQLGTATLSANTATWTGKIKRAGAHNLRAVHVADDFFGGGASPDITVTTFEAKVLPGGALRITGTPGPDTILVTDTGTGVQVTVNNNTRTFTEPTAIWIEAGDGNDVAVLGDNIPAATLLGGNGHDSLYSGNGADQLSGNAGNDSIQAGLGNDTAFGGQGHDTIYGGAGDDRLAGAGGDDQLYGQGGNDTLVGDAGRDTLMGALGDDLLASYDLAADILKGGDGRDIGYFDLKLDIRQDVFELVKGDTPYVLA